MAAATAARVDSKELVTGSTLARHFYKTPRASSYSSDPRSALTELNKRKKSMPPGRMSDYDNDQNVPIDSNMLPKATMTHSDYIYSQKDKIVMGQNPDQTHPLYNQDKATFWPVWVDWAVEHPEVMNEFIFQYLQDANMWVFNLMPIEIDQRAIFDQVIVTVDPHTPPIGTRKVPGREIFYKVARRQWGTQYATQGFSVDYSHMKTEAGMAYWDAMVSQLTSNLWAMMIYIALMTITQFPTDYNTAQKQYPFSDGVPETPEDVLDYDRLMTCIYNKDSLAVHLVAAMAARVFEQNGMQISGMIAERGDITYANIMDEAQIFHKTAGYTANRNRVSGDMIETLGGLNVYSIPHLVELSHTGPESELLQSRRTYGSYIAFYDNTNNLPKGQYQSEMRTIYATDSSSGGARHSYTLSNHIRHCFQFYPASRCESENQRNSGKINRRALISMANACKLNDASVNPFLMTETDGDSVRNRRELDVLLKYIHPKLAPEQRADPARPWWHIAQTIGEVDEIHTSTDSMEQFYKSIETALEDRYFSNDDIRKLQQGVDLCMSFKNFSPSKATIDFVKKKVKAEIDNYMTLTTPNALTQSRIQNADADLNLRTVKITGEGARGSTNYNCYMRRPDRFGGFDMSDFTDQDFIDYPDLVFLFGNVSGMFTLDHFFMKTNVYSSIRSVVADFVQVYKKVVHRLLHLFGTEHVALCPKLVPFHHNCAELDDTMRSCIVAWYTLFDTFQEPCVFNILDDDKSGSNNNTASELRMFKTAEDDKDYVDTRKKIQDSMEAADPSGTEKQGSVQFGAVFDAWVRRSGAWGNNANLKKNLKTLSLLDDVFNEFLGGDDNDEARQIMTHIVENNNASFAATRSSFADGVKENVKFRMRDTPTINTDEIFLFLGVWLKYPTVFQFFCKKAANEDFAEILSKSSSSPNFSDFESINPTPYNKNDTKKIAVVTQVTLNPSNEQRPLHLQPKVMDQKAWVSTHGTNVFVLGGGGGIAKKTRAEILQGYSEEELLEDADDVEENAKRLLIKDELEKFDAEEEKIRQEFLDARTELERSSTEAEKLRKLKELGERSEELKEKTPLDEQEKKFLSLYTDITQETLSKERLELTSVYGDIVFFKEDTFLAMFPRTVAVPPQFASGNFLTNMVSALTNPVKEKAKEFASGVLGVLRQREMQAWFSLQMETPFQKSATPIIQKIQTAFANVKNALENDSEWKNIATAHALHQIPFLMHIAESAKSLEQSLLDSRPDVASTFDGVMARMNFVNIATLKNAADQKYKTEKKPMEKKAQTQIEAVQAIFTQTIALIDLYDKEHNPPLSLRNNITDFQTLDHIRTLVFWLVYVLFYHNISNTVALLKQYVETTASFLHLWDSTFTIHMYLDEAVYKLKSKGHFDKEKEAAIDQMLYQAEQLKTSIRREHVPMVLTDGDGKQLAPDDLNENSLLGFLTEYKLTRTVLAETLEFLHENTWVSENVVKWRRMTQALFSFVAFQGWVLNQGEAMEKIVTMIDILSKIKSQLPDKLTNTMIEAMVNKRTNKGDEFGLASVDLFDDGTMIGGNDGGKKTRKKLTEYNTSTEDDAKKLAEFFKNGMNMMSNHLIEENDRWFVDTSLGMIHTPVGATGSWSLFQHIRPEPNNLEKKQQGLLANYMLAASLLKLDETSSVKILGQKENENNFFGLKYFHAMMTFARTALELLTNIEAVAPDIVPDTLPPDYVRWPILNKQLGRRFFICFLIRHMFCMATKIQSRVKLFHFTQNLKKATSGSMIKANCYNDSFGTHIEMGNYSTLRGIGGDPVDTKVFDTTIKKKTENIFQQIFKNKETESDRNNINNIIATLAVNWIGAYSYLMELVFARGFEMISAFFTNDHKKDRDNTYVKKGSSEDKATVIPEMDTAFILLSKEKENEVPKILKIITFHDTLLDNLVTRNVVLEGDQKIVSYFEIATNRYGDDLKKKFNEEQKKYVYRRLKLVAHTVGYPSNTQSETFIDSAEFKFTPFQDETRFGAALNTTELRTDEIFPERFGTGIPEATTPMILTLTNGFYAEALVKYLIENKATKNPSKPGEFLINENTDSVPTKYNKTDVILSGNTADPVQKKQPVELGKASKSEGMEIMNDMIDLQQRYFYLTNIYAPPDIVQWHADVMKLYAEMSVGDPSSTYKSKIQQKDSLEHDLETMMMKRSTIKSVWLSKFKSMSQHEREVQSTMTNRKNTWKTRMDAFERLMESLNEGQQLYKKNIKNAVQFYAVLEILFPQMLANVAKFFHSQHPKGIAFTTAQTNYKFTMMKTNNNNNNNNNNTNTIKSYLSTQKNVDEFNDWLAKSTGVISDDAKRWRNNFIHENTWKDELTKASSSTYVHETLMQLQPVAYAHNLVTAARYIYNNSTNNSFAHTRFSETEQNSLGGSLLTALPYVNPCYIFINRSNFHTTAHRYRTNDILNDMSKEVTVRLRSFLYTEKGFENAVRSFPNLPDAVNHFVICPPTGNPLNPNHCPEMEARFRATSRRTILSKIAARVGLLTETRWQNLDRFDIHNIAIPFGGAAIDLWREQTFFSQIFFAENTIGVFKFSGFDNTVSFDAHIQHFNVNVFFQCGAIIDDPRKVLFREEVRGGTYLGGHGGGYINTGPNGSVLPFAYYEDQQEWASASDEKAVQLLGMTYKNEAIAAARRIMEEDLYSGLRLGANSKIPYLTGLNPCVHRKFPVHACAHGNWNPKDFQGRLITSNSYVTMRKDIMFPGQMLPNFLRLFVKNTFDFPADTISFMQKCKLKSHNNIFSQQTQWVYSRNDPMEEIKGHTLWGDEREGAYGRMTSKTRIPLCDALIKSY